MKKNSTNYSHERIMPQAPELEASILGQMMISKEAVDVALGILNNEMFYVSKHQAVFNAISILANENQPLDTLTVTEQMRKHSGFEQMGGPAFIASLTRNVLSGENIAYYCHYVQEKYIKREVIKKCSSIMEDAYNDEDVTFSNVEAQFDGIYRRIKGQAEPEVAKKILYNSLNELRSKKDGRLQGVPSGIHRLDRLTMGWQQGDLIIIGARPSVGKTALALQFAINAADSGHKVLFFSLEMTKNEMAIRIFSNQTGIENFSIKTNYNKNAASLWPVCDNFFSQHLFIDDSSSHDIYSIRAEIRRQIRKEYIKLVVVDYLQLIDGEKVLQGNTNRLFGEICRKLKQTAKEMNVPIILLSQLSRDVEKRLQNPFPVLSDLRDSGEIEQHADMVIFPTRFSKLPQAFHYEDKTGRDLRSMALIDVAKYRNGPIEKFFVNVSRDKARWTNSDEESHEQF